MTDPQCLCPGSQQESSELKNMTLMTSCKLSTSLEESCLGERTLTVMYFQKARSFIKWRGQWLNDGNVTKCFAGHLHYIFHCHTMFWELTLLRFRSRTLKQLELIQASQAEPSLSKVHEIFQCWRTWYKSNVMCATHLNPVSYTHLTLPTKVNV